MADDDEGYSWAERVTALAGLLVVAAFGLILADVLCGGRLTGRGGCGCGGGEGEKTGE